MNEQDYNYINIYFINENCEYQTKNMWST